MHMERERWLPLHLSSQPGTDTGQLISRVPPSFLKGRAFWRSDDQWSLLEDPLTFPGASLIIFSHSTLFESSCSGTCVNSAKLW
ncbi:uncharacterized protein LOC143664853 isoform X2 [Tamandua tetradactyla]|uniref:uncharacterized protein LOC143664853 isoform X2 n=1 Tax=Tamandua tetradactyla TaxID=48850 RepID=UPI00405448F7